jgi:hypothetical protein
MERQTQTKPGLDRTDRFQVCPKAHVTKNAGLPAITPVQSGLPAQFKDRCRLLDSGQRQFLVLKRPAANETVLQRFDASVGTAAEKAGIPHNGLQRKMIAEELYPINPSQLASYRQAFRPSRAKDDPVDAELLNHLSISAVLALVTTIRLIRPAGI